MASERTFTLLELNHMVRETIERQMDCKYWVEAELSDLHDRSHCYMELVENDPFGPTPWARPVRCAGPTAGRHCAASLNARPSNSCGLASR